MFITAIGSESKSKLAFRRGVMILLMSVIFLTSAFSVAALNRTAVINVDGKQIQVNLTATNTDDILANAGIKLGKNDVVTTTNENGVITINIDRAFPVYVKTDNNKEKYFVTGGTVENLLKKANIKVTDNHIITPKKETKLKTDMTVRVSEYKTVKLSVDGKYEVVKVPTGTVKEALNYLNVELGKHDKLNCKLTDSVSDYMEIVVTRISYKNVTTIEKIPYETVETYSDQLKEGETEVTTKGVDGEYTIVTKQTIVDGEITETEEISNKITKEVVNEVITIGTNTSETKQTTKTKQKKQASNDSSNKSTESSIGVPVSAENGVLYDENGNTVSYSTVYHGSGTAYYAPAGSLTASGQEVYVGGVAVNPNIIPLGSKLYIVADDGFVYGYATAIDTGGALYDGSAIVDVFYYTYEECVEFGRRDVSVYVLD